MSLSFDFDLLDELIITYSIFSLLLCYLNFKLVIVKRHMGTLQNIYPLL